MRRRIISMILVFTMLISMLPNVLADETETKSSVRIPDDAFTSNGHAYYIYSAENHFTTWSEAENWCENLGGHLAVLTSDEENTAVYGYTGSQSVQMAYFGLSADPEALTWNWVNAEQLNYTNWADTAVSEITADTATRYAQFSGPVTDEGGTVLSEGCWTAGAFESDSAVICEWDTIGCLNSHSWNEGEVTTAADCTTAGEKTYTCSVCGETRTEEIPAAGHTWNNGEITTAADCTTASEKTYTCSVCGETRTEEIPAAGHTWNDGEITTAADCTTAGEKTYTCSVCGGTRTEEISAVGHTWNNGEITTAATCTTAGEKTYTCTLCGEKETEPIPLTEHSIGENGICTICGYYVPDLDTPVDVNISTAGGYCYFAFTPEITDTYRFYSSGSYDTYGYLYDGAMKALKTDDDSGNSSNFSVSYDLIAGTTYFFGARFYSSSKTGAFQVTLTTEHSCTSQVARTATCTAEGEKIYTCKYCNYSYTEAIPVTAHPYTSEITKEPTCTEEGERVYTCSVCGDSYQETIPLVEHQYEETIEDGVITETCRSCGKSYSADLGCSTVAGTGKCGTNSFYAISPEGLLCIFGEGEVSYPNADRYPWYSQKDIITSVTVSTGITAIGAYAFQMETALENVEIGTVQSVGNYAFQGCTALTAVTLTAGNVTIGTYAFAGCTAITDVRLPDSAVIGNYAFSGDTITLTVTKDTGDIPAYFCAVGKYNNIYYNRNFGVEHLVIEDGITSIGYAAFSGCSATVINSMKSVILPSTLISMGASAFSFNEGLLSVDFNSAAAALGDMVFYGDSSVKEYTNTENLVNVAARTFYNNKSITAINLQSVKNVGAYAFSSCTALTSVDLSSVSYIGEYAFESCTALASAKLVSITGIGNCAFQGCTALSSVEFGPVTNIGGSAFENCSSLTTVSLTTSGITLGRYAFSGCSALENVSLPDSAVIGNYAFSGDSITLTVTKDTGEIPANFCALNSSYYRNSGIEALIIAEGITSIGERAFYGRYGKSSNLKSVVLPSTLISIGTYGFAENQYLVSADFSGCSAALDTWAFYNDSGVTEYQNAQNLTSLAANAFYNNSSLTSIDLSTVQTIGYQAFYCCTSLASIHLGSVQSIGEHAFSCCTSLTSIDLESASSIGKYALSYCSSLRSVTLGALTSIDSTVFSNANALRYIYTTTENYAAIQNLMYNIPYTVQHLTLDQSASDFIVRNGVLIGFTGGDESIEIPAEVTAIGAYAFNGCSQLTGTLVIPDNVKTIDMGAFRGCTNLEEIQFGKNLTNIYASGSTEFNALSHCDRLAVLTFNGSLPPYLYNNVAVSSYYQAAAFLSGTYGTPNLNTIYVSKDDLSSYKNCYAQYFNGEITTRETTDDGLIVENGILVGYVGTSEAVEIPESVTGIGSYAFKGNSTIREVILHGRLTSIGAYAFYGSSIEKIEIPSSVSSIGYYAFGSCSELSDVTLDDGLKVLGAYMFADCSKLKTISIPDSFTTIQEHAFHRCTGLTDVSIPDTVTTIDSYAFCQCTGLTDISIPESVSKLGGYVFCSCTGFTQIVLPESVTSIGAGAFSACSGLTGIIIPEHVTALNAYLFSNCTALTDVRISEGVTTIGSSVFEYCKALKEITIPESVTRINSQAFSNCTSLTEITIPDSVTALESAAFIDCTGLKSVSLSEQLTTISGQLFSSCTSLQQIEIPESVTSINADAFANCKALTRLVIPSSVTSIGTYAFYKCYGLTYVIFRGTTDTIAGNSFASCGSLKSVTFCSTAVPANINATGNFSGTKVFFVPQAALENYKSALSSKFPYITIMACGVSSLRAPYVTENAVSLAWDDTSAEQLNNYQIYRNGELFADTDSCSFEDTGLECGTDYTYEVFGICTVDSTDYIVDELSLTVTTSGPTIYGIDTGYGSTIGDVDGRLYAHVKAAGITAEFSYLDADGNEISIPEASTVIKDGKFYYQVPWVVADLDAGEYTVTFRLTDSDGITAAKSAVITVDHSKPEAVTEVQAVPDIGKISVNWSIAHEQATHIYHVYRRTSDEGSQDQLLTEITDRETLFYVDNSASNAVSYIYTVKAVNDFGQESDATESECVSVGTDTTLPQVISLTPETGSTIRGTEVQFTASATDDVGVVQMELYLSDDDGKTWNRIGLENADSISCSYNTTVYAERNIRIKAVAWDAAGNESAGLVHEYRVDNVGPGKVTGLAYTATAGTITLSWNNVVDSDFSFFRLEQLSSGSWIKVRDIYTTLGCNITNLTQKTSISYRVAAYDQAGNRGEASEVLTATTLADTTAPKITSITPDSGSFNSAISFSVTAADDTRIDRIIIQVSRDNEEWEAFNTYTFAGKNSRETVSGVILLEDYEDGTLYLRGIATDTAGNTGDPVYHAYTIDTTAPDAPANLTARIRNGFAELLWDADETGDTASYNVYRSPDNKYFTKIKTGLKQLNYLDSGAEKGKTYYYKVEAVDAAGNVSDSAGPIEVYTEDDTTPPVLVSASPTDGNRIARNSTLTVQVTDNWLLYKLSFAYAADTDDAERTVFYQLTDMNKAGANVTMAMPTEAFANEERFRIYITATDVAGLSAEYVLTYQIDETAPEISDVAVSSDGEKIILQWNGGDEEDLICYRIYRRADHGAETMITQLQPTDGKTAYSYLDQAAEDNYIYYYRIEACDRFQNIRSVTSEGIMLTPGQPLVKAGFSCDQQLEQYVEYQFDASASYADVGIQEYSFDFGDGTIVTQTSGNVIHKYTELGTYTVWLTVTDNGGNTASCSTEVTVQKPEMMGSVEISVKDASGNLLKDVPVYFDMENTNTNIKTTGNTGTVSFSGAAGNYVIGAYLSGYLPTQKNIIIRTKSKTTVELIMVKQPIVTGTFETRRMTLQEIEAANIDITAAENQNVTKTTVQLTYNAQDVQMDFITVNNVVQQVTYSGGSSAVSSGRTLIPISVPAENIMAILDVPSEASSLKEFFDVKLYILNNADSSYELTNNVVTLTVPKGLTLMAENSSPATVAFDSLKGQQTQMISWILRGDEEGEYDLTAAYEGILSQFGTKVTADFKTDEKIRVYAESAMELSTEAIPDVSSCGVYFAVSLKNVGDADLYLPGISAADDVLAKFQEETPAAEGSSYELDLSVNCQLLGSVLTNEEGAQVVLPEGAAPDTLKPGETYRKIYVCFDSKNHSLEDAVNAVGKKLGVDFEYSEVSTIEGLPAAPTVSIDTAEELLNITDTAGDTEYEYSYDGITWYSVTSGAKLTFQDSIWVRIPQKENVMSSMAAWVTVARPEAPGAAIDYADETTVEAYDSSYEYSFDGAAWTVCDGNRISLKPTELAEKTLYIRSRATNTQLTGETAVLTIPARPTIIGDFTVRYRSGGYFITGTDGTYLYSTADIQQAVISENAESFTLGISEEAHLQNLAYRNYLAVQQIATASSFASAVRVLAVNRVPMLTLRNQIDDAGVLTGAGEYECGAEVTVVAAANPGYLFAGWYNGDTLVCKTSEYTFHLYVDCTLIAQYLDCTTVTVTYYGWNDSKLSEGNRYAFTISDPSQITVMTPAVPNGYGFAGWVVNEQLYSSEPELQNAILSLFGTTAEIDVYARFLQPNIEYTVTVEEGTLADGTTGGSWLPCTLLTVTADTPKLGKIFAYWEKDGVTVSYSETYQFYMPTKDTTLKAVYEADGHIWDEGTVAASATCTEPGVMTYTCTDCKKTRDIEIPASGHSWNDGEVTRNATCIEEGERTFTCTTCGRTRTEAIPLTDHSYEAEVIAPSILARGYACYTCSVCGKSYIDENSYTDQLTPDEGWNKADGSWYYFTDGTMQTGWQKISDKWYYLDPDTGAMKTGWQYIDGKWYYLNTSMQTGWQKINGKWYYLNTSMQTGWQQVNGKWYYLGTNGAMQTGWQKINNKWYYLGTNGAMTTGWQLVDDKWYYMGSNGAMQTGWQKINGKWYYLNTSMQTGWQQIGGKWYYLGTNGAMTTDWLKINGSWYYFGTNGAMVSDCTMTIDGKSYTFNENGAWVQ